MMCYLDKLRTSFITVLLDEALNYVVQECQMLILFLEYVPFLEY